MILMYLYFTWLFFISDTLYFYRSIADFYI